MKEKLVIRYQNLDGSHPRTYAAPWLELGRRARDVYRSLGYHPVVVVPRRMWFLGHNGRSRDGFVFYVPEEYEVL